MLITLKTTKIKQKGILKLQYIYRFVLKTLILKKGIKIWDPNIGKHFEQNKSLITFLCLLLALDSEPRLKRIKGLMKVIK